MYKYNKNTKTRSLVIWWEALKHNPLWLNAYLLEKKIISGDTIEPHGQCSSISINRFIVLFLIKHPAARRAGKSTRCVLIHDWN